MGVPEFTQAQLRDQLNYNPATGLFIWRVTKLGAKKGTVAGFRTWNGYWMLCLFRQKVRAHRAAWFYVYGVWPEHDIDHKNGIRDDNRIKNLRTVTRSVNLQNQRKSRSNSSTGFLGVTKHGGIWCAEIKVDGVRHYLGTFKTPELAHEAYLVAKRQLHIGNLL